MNKAAYFRRAGLIILLSWSLVIPLSGAQRSRRPVRDRQRPDATPSPVGRSQSQRRDYVEGELFVKVAVAPGSQVEVSRGLLVEILGAIHREVDSTVIEDYPEIGSWQLVKLKGKTVEAAIGEYRAAFTRVKVARLRAASERREVLDSMILEVEPNDKFSLPKVEYGPPFTSPMVSGAATATDTAVMPNDPLFNKLVGLHNTAQVISSECPNHTGGRDDADIDAPEAWRAITGGDEVVVAVADTGVDYGHEDLRSNMWVNPREIPGNSRDDDGNGVVDDVHGYDGVNNDGDPSDGNGHGTHCAGTIGAVGNNGIGVAGVNWKVKIMAVQLMNAGGDSQVNWVVRAYQYMIRMKQAPHNVNLRVTSNSWAFGTEHAVMRDAFATLGGLNVLNVAAAANAGTNNDQIPYYPANFAIPNLLSIAASNTADDRAEFDSGGGSNWGATTVHLAAPGKYIVSTWIGPRYRCASGTSMATPQVAGAAALLATHRGAMTAGEIRAKLLESGDPLRPSWNSTPISSMRRLNIANAIGTTGPGPTPNPTTPGQILFASNRDGNREIYKMNPDGTQQSRLTNNTFEDYAPSWSPDQKQIVFVSDRDGNPEIYTMDADGNNQTRRTISNGMDDQPDWGGTPATTTPTPVPQPTGNYTVARYTSATLTEGDTDRILNEGMKVLREVDGPDDVSTVVDLRRNGAVAPFGAGDGSIDSQAEFDQVDAVAQNAKVVNEITYCGGTHSVNIIGCAGPGSSLVVERISPANDLEGILWMHEYGHNKRLGHRNQTGAIMHETIASTHRRVNGTESAAYLRPSLAGGDEPPQPAQTTPVPVQEFVRRIYVHGLPYAEASSYGKENVPVLLRMLNDPSEAPYWANVVALLCIIGDADVFDPLSEFFRRGDGRLTIEQYRAKRSVLMSLGYLINRTKSEKALDFLRRGLDPAAWNALVRWRTPYHPGVQDTNLRLTELSIIGLALAGTPESGRALQTVRSELIPKLSAEGKSSVQSLLDEALKTHARVMSEGLAGYYRNRR